MRHPSIIKIKALSLLVIFSWSMVIGFACSLGIDMGYNRNHHQYLASAKSVHTAPACHVVANDSSDSKSESSNNDCCSDGVAKFLKLDKNAASLLNVDVSRPVVELVYQLNFHFELTSGFQHAYLRDHRLMRSDHPPQKDVRTAIQSFLI